MKSNTIIYIAITHIETTRIKIFNIILTQHLEKVNAFFKKISERRTSMASKPFTQVGNGFIRCGGLTAFQKMTFITLCSFKDKHNKCHPSIGTLAAAVGCTERTIIKSIKVLVSLGLISKSKVQGSNVNKYTILSDGEFLSYNDEPISQSNEIYSPALVNEVHEVSEPISDKEEPKNNNHFDKNHQSINREDGIDTIGAYRELIKSNIEYDIMCERYDAERVSEVVELMLDVVCGKPGLSGFIRR